jgi:hypothetical protein
VSRFRHDRGRAVAGMIVTISLFTLATVSPWFLLLPLPAGVWTWWAWRAGTDADQDGLRVRALVGRRRVRWSEVSALHPDEHQRILATISDGRDLLLTGVTSADLPRLVAASGHPLPPVDP